MTIGGFWIFGLLIVCFFAFLYVLLNGVWVTDLGDDVIYLFDYGCCWSLWVMRWCICSIVVIVDLGDDGDFLFFLWLQDFDLHHHLGKCSHGDTYAAAAKPASHAVLWVPNHVCPTKSHIVTLVPLLRSQSVMEVSIIQICDNANSDPNHHAVPSAGWSHSRGPCGAWSQSLSTDNDQVPAPGLSFSGTNSATNHNTNKVHLINTAVYPQ